MLESHQLATLIAVVDEESFEGAAYVLGVSTSAVSQRIRALEEAVGQTVVRRAQPVEPTPAGAILLRLARQEALLRADALTALGQDSGRTVIRLVMNADSLATWAMPALQQVHAERAVVFDIRREDQDHSIAHLREGSAMAAVTSVADPVPGCSVTELGAMTYHPMASRTFVDRWFADGITPDALAVAPLVNFDRSDELQSRWLKLHTRRHLTPPIHYVPGSTTFVDAVRLGLGWGMIPAQQRTEDLVELVPGESVDVPLYWQRWRLDSPLLDEVSTAIIAAAGRELVQAQTLKPRTRS